MPNQKYLELQNIYYSTVIENYDSRKIAQQRASQLFDCDCWITREKHVIPIVFMRDDHMIKAWNIFKNSGYALITQYQLLIEESRQDDLEYNPMDYWKSDKFDVVFSRLSALEDEFKRRKINGYSIPDKFYEFDKLLNPYDYTDDYGGIDGHPHDYED